MPVRHEPSLPLGTSRKSLGKILVGGHGAASTRPSRISARTRAATRSVRRLKPAKPASQATAGHSPGDWEMRTPGLEVSRWSAMRTSEVAVKMPLPKPFAGRRTLSNAVSRPNELGPGRVGNRAARNAGPCCERCLGGFFNAVSSAVRNAARDQRGHRRHPRVPPAGRWQQPRQPPPVRRSTQPTGTYGHR